MVFKQWGVPEDMRTSEGCTEMCFKELGVRVGLVHLAVDQTQ